MTTEHNNDLMINCDGLCEPNPGGVACWAWIAYDPKGKRLREAYGTLGRGPGMTGNLAEYHAVLEALRYTRGRLTMLAERGMGVVIYTDSQLVVKQVTGEWRVNSPGLIAIRGEVVAFFEWFKEAGVPLQFIWQPRELNTAADELTRKAFKEARPASRPPMPEWLT